MKSRQFNGIFFKIGFIAAFFLCSIAGWLLREAGADGIIYHIRDHNEKIGQFDHDINVVYLTLVFAAFSQYRRLVPAAYDVINTH